MCRLLVWLTLAKLVVSGVAKTPRFVMPWAGVNGLNSPNGVPSMVSTYPSGSPVMPVSPMLQTSLSVPVLTESSTSEKNLMRNTRIPAVVRPYAPSGTRSKLTISVACHVPESRAGLGTGGELLQPYAGHRAQI